MLFTTLGLFVPPYFSFILSSTDGPIAATAGADITNSPSVKRALTRSDPYGPSTKPSLKNKPPPENAFASPPPSLEPPENKFSRAMNPPAVAANCRPLPIKRPLPPRRLAASPPALLSPSLLSSIIAAAPSLTAPLASNPVNLIAALPNVVPNNKNAASSFGPLSLKNLMTD